MYECPSCEELLELSTDCRGSRKASGANIEMVEMGQDISLTAHCVHCDATLGLWAKIVDVEER